MPQVTVQAAALSACSNIEIVLPFNLACKYYSNHTYPLSNPITPIMKVFDKVPTNSGLPG
jgi:hypothetical protein